MNAISQSIADKKLKKNLAKERRTMNGCMPSLLALIAVAMTIFGGIWFLNLIGGAG